MRHRLPLPPPPNLSLLLFLVLSLLALPSSVLSHGTDEAYNPSAASFLSLSPSFHTAISVLIRVFSSFSLLFSSFVVAAFFLVPRLRHEYNARFVLLLAVSDMLHALLLLLGPLSEASAPSSLLFPASASPSGWCSAHSSLLLYASLVSLAWTSVIAINHWAVVYHAASILQLRRYQLAQHIGAWLLPLMPVLLLLLLPSSNAALASPLCWFGMADARLEYPSSAWLLLLPQLLNCALLSGCYMLALRYGRRLTSQVVTGPASGTQTKETSQIGAVSGGASVTYQKASSGPATAQSDRAVLSDKYGQMKRRVSLYLLCAFLLTFPLLLSSLSLLPSASLSAGYLSFLFLLQALVGSSQGTLHGCVYGWNLRLFYHLYPAASHPPLLTSLLRALHLPPPPPAMSPATSPPFMYASRIHPSVLGQPAVSPYMSSRVVSTIGRNSWRASSVMMTQLPGYSGRMPMRRVDGAANAAAGAGGDEDDSGSAGSMHATPILTTGVLLASRAVEPTDARLSTMLMDGSSDSISPMVSRNAPPSVGGLSGGRRFSITTTIAGLPAINTEGGSFSVAHPHSITASPVLSMQGESLPPHLQPLTSFSSFSNPQSALPWIPSLSLPPHHPLALPALVTPGLAPIRVLRTGSSFSSSSRASVSFLSPTHQSSLTPRSDGGSSGSGDSGESVSSGSIRVTVSGWDGGSGLTARRCSQEEMKELETLNEEDEKDSEDTSTPGNGTAHRPSLHNGPPSSSLTPASSAASSPSAASNEQSRGTVIVSSVPAASPTAATGSHSPRSMSPSASNCPTPPSSHHSRYSFSLASFGGRASLSTPSSSRSSPHLATRVMPAGYSPRPSTAFDRRPLRVNPAPPASASAAVSPRATPAVLDRNGSNDAGGTVTAGVVETGTGGVRRPKLTSRQSLPLTVAAMPVELRTGAIASHRLNTRRQSEPVVTQ